MKIDGKEWRLVPVKATVDMKLSGAVTITGRPRNNATRYYMGDAWSAMLAAAPQPDIEAMVEGVARVIVEAVAGSWDSFDADIQEASRTEARAVLRHLFGGE